MIDFYGAKSYPRRIAFNADDADDVYDADDADDADNADDADDVYDMMESVLEGANQGVCLNPSDFLSYSRSWTNYCSRASQSCHHSLMSLTLKIRRRKNKQTKCLRKFDFSSKLVVLSAIVVQLQP